MRSPFGCGKLFESYTHTHTLVHTESGAGLKRIKGGKEKEKIFQRKISKRIEKVAIWLVGERPPTLLMIMQDSIYSTSGAEATLPHWPTANSDIFTEMSKQSTSSRWKEIVGVFFLQYVTENASFPNFFQGGNSFWSDTPRSPPSCWGERSSCRRYKFRHETQQHISCLSHPLLPFVLVVHYLVQRCKTKDVPTGWITNFFLFGHCDEHLGR
jgi:hypothetical protein